MTDAHRLVVQARDDLGRARALTGLGRCRLRCGELEEARSALTVARSIYRTRPPKDRQLASLNLLFLGKAQQQLGNPAEGRETLQQGIDLLEGKTEATDLLGALFVARSMCEFRLGHRGQAAETAARAVRIGRSQGDDTVLLADALEMLGITVIYSDPAESRLARAVRRRRRG